jgi:hypothetical protein
VFCKGHPIAHQPDQVTQERTGRSAILNWAQASGISECLIKVGDWIRAGDRKSVGDLKRVGGRNSAGD